MGKEQIFPRSRDRGRVNHPFTYSLNKCYNFILFDVLNRGHLGESEIWSLSSKHECYRIISIKPQLSVTNYKADLNQYIMQTHSRNTDLVRV